MPPSQITDSNCASFPTLSEALILMQPNYYMCRPPLNIYSLWSMAGPGVGLGAREAPGKARDPRTPVYFSDQELFSIPISTCALRVVLRVGTLASPVAGRTVPGPPWELAWGTPKAVWLLVVAEAVWFGNTSNGDLSCSCPAVPMGASVRAATRCNALGEASTTELCCDGLMATHCSVFIDSSLLAVTPVAVGLLSPPKTTCGARPFSKGTGGALVGEWPWSISLSPRGSAAERCTEVLISESTSATISVVSGEGLTSSGADSVLFVTSGAIVSVRGSTISPATQQVHVEMGPQTGCGGTRVWPENRTETSQPHIKAYANRSWISH